MGSEFDDLIDMGELVGKLGDNGEIPPEMAAAQAVEPDPVQVIEPEQHSYSGGLSGVPGIEDGEKSLDIDELLGFGKPSRQQVHDEPKGDASAPKPGSIEERMAELSERLRKAEADRDRLIEVALSGRTVPEQPQEPESPAVELHAETAEFMNPYIEAVANKLMAERDARIAALEQELEPTRMQTRDEQLAAEIAKFVPGFNATHMDVLHKEYDKISDPEQKAIIGDGIAGAAILAKDLASRGALDLGKGGQRTRVSPLVSRHHTEGGGPRSAGSYDGGDEKAQIAALMKLPADKFLEAWNRQFPDN